MTALLITRPMFRDTVPALTALKIGPHLFRTTDRYAYQPWQAVDICLLIVYELFESFQRLIVGQAAI